MWSPHPSTLLHRVFFSLFPLACAQLWSGVQTLYKEKGKEIAKITSLAGIGLTFEKNENGGGLPSIKEILPRGSAYRDNTVELNDSLSHIDSESVNGMKMDQLRERILGIAGTKVRLTIQKTNGRVLDVVLTRGSPEWWAFYDDNERLRKDLATRDKEVEMLKKKLRDAEDVLARDRQEIDNLHGQVASLEHLNQKMQMDLDREVDLRRRSENMFNSLTAEKKHLDDQVENLLKKVSEVTLSFKSAQGLAREMTEKARQSEQGRANEEKLRKLAEARETKSQSLLLDEILRRKDAETETSTLQARMQALEAKIQHQDDLVQRIAKFSGEINELQGNLIITKNEVDSGKKYIEKMQEENRLLHSKCGDLEVVALMAKKEATDAKDSLKVAHDINSSTTASKDEAIKREGEASRTSVTSDAQARSMLNKQASTQAAYDRLKEELGAAVKTASDAAAAAQKDRLAVKDLTDKLNAMTLKLGDVQAAKDKHDDLLASQLSAAESRVTEQKQKIATMEASNLKLASDLTSKSTELNDAISQAALELNLARDKSMQLDADLKRALADEREVRATMLSFEAKVLAAHQEKETSLSQLRLAKSQIEALMTDKTQLEHGNQAQYLEIQVQKAEILKVKQEKTGIEKAVLDMTARCNELNQQLLAVQTQLRVKTGEAETLSMRVADLENQLSSMPALKKEVLAQKSRIRDLEDLIAALKAENARVTEAELKTRSEVTAGMKQIEDLKNLLTQQKIENINEIGELKRQHQEKYYAVCNERDDAATELQRYYSLPNACGVGMGLEQTTVTLPTGGTISTCKVAGFVPGQSADLSGALKIGDDLLEVDGIPALGMSLDQIKGKLLGKRGTKVTLRMMRDLSDDGMQNGEMFNICLKRGAWGPEHAVLAPEVSTCSTCHLHKSFVQPNLDTTRVALVTCWHALCNATYFAMLKPLYVTHFAKPQEFPEENAHAQVWQCLEADGPSTTDALV